MNDIPVQLLLAAFNDEKAADQALSPESKTAQEGEAKLDDKTDRTAE